MNIRFRAFKVPWYSCSRSFIQKFPKWFAALQQKISSSLLLSPVSVMPIKSSLQWCTCPPACEILSARVFTCIIYPNRGRIHQFRSGLLCMTVPVYSAPSGFVSQRFFARPLALLFVRLCVVTAPCARLRVLCRHVCLPRPKPLRPSPGPRESSPRKAWQSPSVWKWLRLQR